MILDAIPAGLNPPHGANVRVEGPIGDEPPKCELDKKAGVPGADRFLDTAIKPSRKRSL
jgi:inorganic pyrophosphatase